MFEQGGEAPLYFTMCLYRGARPLCITTWQNAKHVLLSTSVGDVALWGDSVKGASVAILAQAFFASGSFQVLCSSSGKTCLRGLSGGYLASKDPLRHGHKHRSGVCM